MRTRHVYTLIMQNYTKKTKQA